MATEVKVPTLGESITEATLGQWLKKPGEAVRADEPIASLETDKVAVEVPSPVAGVMGEQLVAEGANVEVGAVIARIEAGDGAAVQPAAAPAAVEIPVNPSGAGENIEPKEAPKAEAPKEEEPQEDDGPHLTLSPAVRRIVLEHHLDPSRIKGTGKDGRLTKDDVLAAAEQQKGEAPAPPPAAMKRPCCRSRRRSIPRERARISRRARNRPIRTRSHI